MAWTASITAVGPALNGVQVTVTITNGTRSISIPYIYDPDTTQADIKADLLSKKQAITAIIVGVLALQPLIGQAI